ncbi:MAG: DegV family protein [Eubacteriaceae bacterium]|nr:DegV family protein [Eubacteriaceae bacterium]
MVKIITDSSTLYTQAEAEKFGVDALPLCVAIGDYQGRDLISDYDDFYGRIANGQHPKSSQPPVGEVIEHYEKYKGEFIINIAMADGLSGTYQSAVGARETVENKEDIHVINTKTLCGPHRYMLEKAVKMRDEGKTGEEIVAWLEYAADHNESFLIPQDFDFLRRGGRLTPMAATLGSVLKLKPVMTQVEDGRKLDKIAVKRTMSSAFGVVIDTMKTRNISEKHIIYVSHARVEKDALKAKEMLNEAFPGVEVIILELSHAFITQGGPHCVAIQYIER